MSSLQKWPVLDTVSLSILPCLATSSEQCSKTDYEVCTRHESFQTKCKDNMWHNQQIKVTRLIERWQLPCHTQVPLGFPCWHFHPLWGQLHTYIRETWEQFLCITKQGSCQRCNVIELYRKPHWGVSHIAWNPQSTCLVWNHVSSWPVVIQDLSTLEFPVHLTPGWQQVMV